MKAASTSPVTCPLWWAPCSLGGRPPLGHPLDLPLLCGLGAGPAPARGRVAAPAGGRGERGSRGGERGRRARGDLRNRKHLFALGGVRKKQCVFSSTGGRSLLPARGALPFPAQPCCLTLAPSQAAGLPPGQGGSGETSSPSTCAPQPVVRWHAPVPGAGAPELPGHGGVGSCLATQSAAEAGGHPGRVAASHRPESVPHRSSPPEDGCSCSARKPTPLAARRPR